MLKISTTPHIFSPVTTQSLMRDVLIALTPAIIVALLMFGIGALKVLLTSVAACVMFEYHYPLSAQNSQYDQRLLCNDYRRFAGIQPAQQHACLDDFSRCVCCHRYNQNGIRRIRKKYFQSCTGRTCLSVYFLSRTNDHLAQA